MDEKEALERLENSPLKLFQESLKVNTEIYRGQGIFLKIIDSIENSIPYNIIQDKIL